MMTMNGIAAWQSSAEALLEGAHGDDQVQPHGRRQIADLQVEDHDQAEQHLVVAVGLRERRQQRRQHEDRLAGGHQAADDQTAGC